MKILLPQPADAGRSLLSMRGRDIVTTEAVQLLLLHHDIADNVIRASRIQHHSSKSPTFPTAFSLCGGRYAVVPPVGPFQITFWDHLWTVAGPDSVVAGFEFLLMRGNDEIIMNSSFCRADLSNLKRMSIDDESFMIEILLLGETENVASDCCQAFGSAYYTDGSNVAVALMNWDNETKYGFPVSSENVSAVNW